MLAFHNDPEIKQKYLDRVKSHFLADEIIKGKYWENGKGCAVGCTIHSSNHKSFEIELGIPAWLARIEDRIFEGLPNEEAKKWPEDFLSNIKPGIDLEQIKIPFLIFIVESVIDKFDHDKFPEVKLKILHILKLLKELPPDRSELKNAAYAAYAAAGSVDSAASAAAYAAAYAADAADAYAAAYADAYAAAYAADAYADAYAAAYAVSAVAAIKEKTYKKFADKLLELIRECK